MTEREKRNLAAVDRWIDTYNNDVDKMVDEVYAPDCVVCNMFAGYVLNGREELRALEHKISEQVPTRRMTLDKTLASGDSVAVEVSAVFGDHHFPGIVVLTFNEAGQVIEDHTYAPADPNLDAVPPS